MRFYAVNLLFWFTRTLQEATDDYYDFEIVNTISTADWILLLLIISFWLFLEKNIYKINSTEVVKI